MDNSSLVENRMKNNVVKIESIGKQTEKGPINLIQEKVINKFEEILNFLKAVTIKNEESLNCIEKPLDEILTSLKFLPIDPSFDIFPKEIKTKILSYLCNNEAFMAASTCQDWKHILHPRLGSMQNVCIGKHCDECEKNRCFNPIEMLKASITLQLDIPLAICHPVIDVDSELVTKALTSVSKISLNTDCDCKITDDCYEYDDAPLINTIQVQSFLEGLDKNKIFESVEVKGCYLDDMDHERMMICFVNKSKSLTYNELEDSDYLHMNIEPLIRNLQESADIKLENLNLGTICEYSDELSQDLADALCNVNSVKLYDDFPLRAVTAKRLEENIRLRAITMKRLVITLDFDWRNLIDPQDLKIVIDKMDVLSLRGNFTLEQLGVALSAPQVQTSSIDVPKNLFKILKRSL